MSELSVTKPFHIRRDRHGRKRLKVGEAATPEKIPRIARLMALAIRFDELIRSGAFADQAELARLGMVSRARVTQIMDLLLLAPAIQEALLDTSSPSDLSERQLRPLVGKTCWNRQLQKWQSLVK